VKWPGREGSLDRHEQIAGRYTIKRDEEEERTVRWMGLSKWLTNTPSSGAKRRKVRWMSMSGEPAERDEEKEKEVVCWTEFSGSLADTPSSETKRKVC
jgi:hypothetical protein